MSSLTATDRRTVLRLIAAGAATALAGCSRPAEQTWPRAVEPDGDEPGKLRRYATALALAGYARGVTGLVVDGRPIKLEGLENHPASLGATDLFGEVSILDLYDPQRLRAATEGGQPTDDERIAGQLQQHRAAAGRGLRLLTGRVTSPSLLARIAQMRQRYPEMRHYRSEAIDDDQERAGATMTFGRVLSLRPRLGDADVILALDADPLGPGPDQIAWARSWAERRIAKGRPAPRLHAIEPSLTQTGACADRRIAAPPGACADALLALAARMGAGGITAPPLPPHLAQALPAIARDLAGAKGRALVLVGRGQPAPVHALAAWINQQLAAPAGWIAPVDLDPAAHGESLAALATEMHAGQVSTLVILDSNPAYHAPASLGFAEAMRRVPLVLAAAAFPSETTAAARIVLPLSSPLESWGDLRGPDGTASIVQPLINPLYQTRSPLGMLDLIDPAGAGTDHDRVRAQWQTQAGADPDGWWQQALVAGVIPASASTPVAARAAAPRAYPPSSPASGMTLQLMPSPTLWDGRFASNAWAQECPDPLTKEVWGSALRMGAADARELGLSEGDIVALGAGGEAPVRIVSGQARGVATLLLGQGRRDSGPLAANRGANGFALRSGAGWTTPAPLLKPTGKNHRTTSTQGTFKLEGDLAHLFPEVSPDEVLPNPARHPSLLPDPHHPGTSPRWAMAIDTAVCIGCNACVVACQAENNVPAIGPEQMWANRDMHWIRIDRYDRGDSDPAGDDPRPGFQPVPCMQCEEAPCEPVCPVGASIHDHQGLNDQVYNRCVGTRTCQANCPYKVRRFNFLDYSGANIWQADDPGSVTAQRNPDVTVRARGVMEKCTYCVQRIESAVREADATGEPRAQVVTACQSACPTRAITFGDLSEPGAPVIAAREDPRHYVLLGELGTRPRTTYLAKIRNTPEPGGAEG